MKKVIVLGCDGYIGWALSVSLVKAGHQVLGIDNCFRRDIVEGEMRSASAVRIASIRERTDTLQREGPFSYMHMDLSGKFANLELKTIFDYMQPDVIYHLGQMPSAPYSMIDMEHCLWTHQNNMTSTLHVLYAMKEACPNAHLIKIGSMGEYGTPSIPLPEGKCTVIVDGMSAEMPFPRDAGSWYHQTKVHDTHNIRLACKLWGLKCTDVMQGIVYGSRVEAMGDNATYKTRIDFDECFGTVIHRMVVQAVLEHPLTVYGKGTQKRSVLPLQDSVNCLILIGNSPPDGYREINQFHEYYTIGGLAELIRGSYLHVTGKTAEIQYIENPRVEASTHIYKPINKKLKTLGYSPSSDICPVVCNLVNDVLINKSNLTRYKNVIDPKIKWAR